MKIYQLSSSLYASSSSPILSCISVSFHFVIYKQTSVNFRESSHDTSPVVSDFHSCFNWSTFVFLALNNHLINYFMFINILHVD